MHMEKKKVRLTMEMPVALRARILELEAESGASSMAEVIRRALSAYGILLAFDRDGGTVVLVNKNDEKERLRLV
jgi:hypothetical protein